MSEKQRDLKRAGDFFGIWAIGFCLFSAAGGLIYLAIAFVAWNVQWPGELMPTVLRLIVGVSAVLGMFAAVSEA